MNILYNLEKHRIIKFYKEFTSDDFDNLQKSFDLNKFLGSWQQVLTTLSTSLFTTGPDLSNVQAQYTLKENGLVNVFNSAINNKLECETINGESGALDDDIPCCRYVQFDNRDDITRGNYWITYINHDFSVIIVVAPIILLGINISNNFGCYVLVKNRDNFWKNKHEVNNVFTYLKSKGFTNFWNEPIFSSSSIDKKCSN